MRLSVLFVFAAIVVSATGLAGNASAQKITIETSADDHGGKFFGEGAVRVVVEDENTDDSGSDGIEVELDVDGIDGSFTIPNTSDGSQRFEFFIMHVNSFLNDTAGGYPELDGIADDPIVITFGNGGDLDTGGSLFNDVEIEITYRDNSITIDYEETFSALTLDRDSYGTTSYVYVRIADQDANLNPTKRDEFTVDPGSGPNDDLLVLAGGNFEDPVTFRETGYNTAVFEGRYRLGESIIADSESLSLTLFDKANYGDDLGALENDSNNSDEVSFTVGNTEGTLGSGGQQIVTWDPIIEAGKESYELGDTVQVTITDQDANVNSGAADSIQLMVSSGGGEIEVTALETGANTGIFKARFRLAEETGGDAITPSGSATITYTDERPADYFEKVQAGENPEKDFTLEVDVKLPVKTGTESIDVTPPRLADVTGRGGLGGLSAGDSVVLATTIYNNNEQEQPFVAIIEVRDSEGTTVYLALQGGTLEPSGATEIGVLWQPGTTGTYEVRSFAITSVGIGAEPLSLPAISTITVI